jgi:hypothetical protein
MLRGFITPADSVGHLRQESRVIGPPTASGLYPPYLKGESLEDPEGSHCMKEGK